MSDKKNKPVSVATEEPACNDALNTTTVIHNSEKIKKRYWRFEVYPESAPEDWLEYLKQTCIEFAISPLHDKDVYTKNVRDEDDTDLVKAKKGDLKKAHYHGIFAFNNPTTFKNVYENFLKPLGQPIPLSCDNVRRAYEYFWHKNDPDKYQYNKADVKVFNGFDVLNYINIEQRRVLEIKRELVNFIKEKPIFEPIDFLDEIEKSFADREDFLDYLDIAFSNTTAFNVYIRSNRHKAQTAQTRVPTAPEPSSLAEEVLPEN